MYEEILKKIGLTEGEKNVYLALLELGDSTRGEIVNKSRVAGSKVYELLEKLREKGLVSIYVKNKFKHFKPTNPRQVLNYLEEKKEEILRIEKQTSLILPDLLAKYNSSKEDQEVELIVGFKGLEIIFREQVDIMNKGEICYVLGGTRGDSEEAVQAFFEKIHLLREKKRIKTKMIYNIRQKDTVKEYYSSKKYPSTQTKFLEHTSPVAVNIYKDRTVIIIYGKKITSIYIRSKDVAQSFLEYFNLLWKIAKK